MKKLTGFKKGETCHIKSIQGDSRFIGRISSMGLTTDSEIQIVQNGFGMPLLLFSHDTLIAISKKEAGRIMAQKIEESYE
ncbi:MAG: ferrous iron transport protein A [Proteobacteria bacterium]|nr:ferrous iron transport protein A [Pseudomonadota bacterium]